MLLFLRNRSTNLLPLIMGLFLKVGGASYRVISTFNRTGVSVSVRTIDRLKAFLSLDAFLQAQALFLSERLFIIIFDNINIYVRHTEQRINNKNTMLNATNIALIALPSDADPAGEDLQAKLDLRGKRSEDRYGKCLDIDGDTKHFDDAYTAIIAQMLCAYWPGREKWHKAKEMEQEIASMMPEIRPLTPEKTETFPMGVVDVDEGSKKGIVAVLEEIQQMLSLPPDEFSKKLRIICGDLGTVRNLRAARRDRMDDVDSMEQLKYIQELSQLFHWALNAVHMLVRVHLDNSVQDPGSLSNHKDKLDRKWDVNVNRPDYAAAKSLLRHSFTARLFDCVM